VQVGALTDWQQVAAGNAFGAAVKTDGTLWTWGTNNYGQNGLGTSTATMASSPTQVGALTTWAKVATGYEHVLALKSDGTLWSWGNNGNGQLGDGTAVAKSSPIQIGALTTWKDISAGVYHSLAIQNDGSLWGWGENYSGQAAGVSMTSPSSPVQIGSLTTWSKVAASYSHTFALKVDGTLWSWGDNSIGPGNLGSGSTSSRTSPVQVGTVNTWSTLSTGSHVMYIRSS
jgi:alpha-tubulin suppressor-like RCC1 family protein